MKHSPIPTAALFVLLGGCAPAEANPDGSPVIDATTPDVPAVKAPVDASADLGDRQQTDANASDAGCQDSAATCRSGEAGYICSETGVPAQCVAGDWRCAPGMILERTCQCIEPRPPSATCGASGWVLGDASGQSFVDTSGQLPFDASTQPRDP